MKTAAIITELNLKTTNYGNRLQSFALNYYLNKKMKIKTDTIIFTNNNIKITNKFLFFLGKFSIKKVYNKIIARKKVYIEKNDINIRLDECNRFTSENVQIKIVNKKSEIEESKYEYLIVGSDVVWSQFRNGVNKDKFLDFKGIGDYKRIAYAASFGKNWIPKENVKYICSQLKKFDNISVREHSSVELLNENNIKNVVHVCDPTLLLDEIMWKKIEKEVDITPEKKYIFTYLLGKNQKQRETIKEYANRKGYLIVNIPNADGEKNDIDRCFGDISVDHCSPEQWLWLIDNSELVVTDSFHGCVFSNIFKKKYVILKRESISDINIRMTDFLENINQKDKFVDINEFDSKIDNLKWDYKDVDKRINKLINISKNYLNKALNVN